jgi:hypothetical protein
MASPIYLVSVVGHDDAKTFESLGSARAYAAQRASSDDQVLLYEVDMSGPIDEASRARAALSKDRKKTLLASYPHIPANRIR